MKLAAYLKANGLSNQDFAAKIGKSGATVSRIARDLHAPDWPTMRAIVDATAGQVTPNDFHGGLPTRPEERPPDPPVAATGGSARPETSIRNCSTN